MEAISISGILAARSVQADQVAEAVSDWNMRRDRAIRLREELRQLKKTFVRARSEHSAQMDDALELERYVDELDRDQVLRKMVSECSFADAELKKLSLRFGRKTLNIAVAGVGRCGKSTALKSIIGSSQTDNSIIPSGNGPAVTAGKSVICCVLSADEERTEVEYHTAESFLNGVVNPLLASISLGNHVCSSLEQFEDLDYEMLKEEVVANGRTAEATVRALKASPSADGDEADRQMRIAGAQAYAGAFKLYLERLNDLRRIISAFPFFREMLTGSTETVSLRETCRYVSYPRDGGPAICYAVKGCRIFSRFPNNEVAELQLTDLPGLGTGSESEKKCFFEGFDYTVDLALAVRRPEGLFQNFTTDDDLSVLNVLGGVFGEEHLHECMVLFQNDGGLPKDGADLAFARIEEWNASRAQPILVLRGDAYDHEYMQKMFLPEAVRFMERNLPSLDAALLADVMPGLRSRAEKMDAELSAIKSRLKSLANVLPVTEGANAIADKAAEILNALMSGLNDLMGTFSDSLRSDSRAAEAVTKLSLEVKSLLASRYSEEDERIVATVKNSIQAHQSAIPYANKQVHAIRILVGEVYSKLGDIHAKQLSDMRKAVAEEFRKVLPTLLNADVTLEEVCALFEADGCCPEIADAVKALVELDAPFYNIVYPDIRKEVFDAMADIERNFLRLQDLPPEQEAKVVLRELRNTGENWGWKTERLLRMNSRIPDIVCAAIERCQDRIVRNAVARRELVDFLERNWSNVMSGGDSYATDIRGRIMNLMK